MSIELTPVEARVIGCLIEKQITTPDQYPLSLNALTNACNQKSNRDPVMSLAETEVQDALDALNRKCLVSTASSYGSRVAKYQHRFCNTEFGELKLSDAERGVVCELLLRGPQTPGELRTRASRLCQLADVQAVEAVLESLHAREGGPYVQKLPRQPGKREHRYAHLFCGELDEQLAACEPELGRGATGSLAERVSQLETELTDLRQQVAELQRQLDGD